MWNAAHGVKISSGGTKHCFHSMPSVLLKSIQIPQKMVVKRIQLVLLIC